MYYMYDSLVIAESMHILPHFFLKLLYLVSTEDRGGTTKKHKDKDNGGLFYLFFILFIFFNL